MKHKEYKEGYQFSTDCSPVFFDTILPRLQGKKVLDLGCGKGSYLTHFAEGSLGLDASSQNIATATQQGLRVQQMDLNHPEPLKEQFDAVFLSHLLEHVDAPISLLRYARAQVKPGGTVIVSVPNELSVIHRFYPYYTGDGNHLYHFTPSNMKELLALIDVKDPHINYDYHTALTRRLKLTPYLGIIDALPPIVRYPLSWALWYSGDISS